MENSKPITENELLGLKKIRRKRLIAIILFLLYLPSILVISIIVPDSIMPIYLIGYVIIFLCVIFPLSLSECPRCHNKFFVHVFTTPFTRKFLHCGLRLRERKAAETIGSKKVAG